LLEDILQKIDNESNAIRDSIKSLSENIDIIKDEVLLNFPKLIHKGKPSKPIINSNEPDPLCSSSKDNLSGIVNSSKDHGLSKIDQIVTDYNQNLSNFTKDYHVKFCAFISDSIDNINRGHEENIVILEETNSKKGNYWLFSIDSISYLVPGADIIVNQHIYNAVKMIFEECSYIPDYKKIKVVKPAKVVLDATTNTWRIKEHGEIQFS
jgi:hypothetical protein